METLRLPSHSFQNYQKPSDGFSQKFSRFIQPLFQKFLKWRKMRQDREYLMHMNDRMLKDIGLTRRDIRGMNRITGFNNSQKNLSDVTGKPNRSDLELFKKQNIVRQEAELWRDVEMNRYLDGRKFEEL